MDNYKQKQKQNQNKQKKLIWRSYEAVQNQACELWLTDSREKLWKLLSSLSMAMISDGMRLHGWWTPQDKK